MNATAEHAASDYERLLKNALPHGRLDAVLLGMGADGHTASLFPRSMALAETRRWVVSNDGPTVVPPARITLTAPFLNATRWAGALVVGESKRAMLKNVFDGTIAPADAPIRMITPDRGITYYIDHPADPRQT
jgi:6-phosphogluconolactonase